MALYLAGVRKMGESDHVGVWVLVFITLVGLALLIFNR